MNVKIKEATKKYIINLTILLIFFSAIINIIISMPSGLLLVENVTAYYKEITHSNIQIYGLLRRMIGVLLLVISYYLYKRVRFAWIITLISLTVSVTLHLTRFQGLINGMMLGEIMIIGILVVFQGDFQRKSNPTSVKKAVLVSSCSMLLVLISSSISFFAIRGNYRGLQDFIDCLVHSVQLLFFMDTSAVATTQIGKVYGDITMVFNWICMIVALALILRPIIYNPIITKNDRECIARLVERYGQNPMSYLALEHDKKYFFGKGCTGVIAFAVIGDVIVCCGDMICSDDEAPAFLMEFMKFCKENNYAIVFLNITNHFLSFYKTMGFDSVKYGEDACFLLSEYSLAGGKVAKVRAAINHANKAGMTVSEYRPKVQREPIVEAEIEEVSKDWLASKKNGELAFMLGGLGLDEPYNRRFFVARDVAGKMLGFVVFVPYESGSAYLADVTRRRNDAPQGVIEKLIYEGFMTFKAEGVEWGSMGLVPLVNVRESNVPTKLTTKLFEYIYENLNDVYGFKPLHHAKEKYAPTHWQPRYLAYYPKHFTPQIAYAIVKVQNPEGILEYISPMLKKKRG